MNALTACSNAFGAPQTLTLEEDSGGALFWLRMHTARSRELSGGRDCFTPTMLQDARAAAAWLHQRVGEGSGRPGARLPHLVVCSAADVFNLGGDLAHFSTCIRAKDRPALLAYARQCIEGVHGLHTGMGMDIKTVALVQGRALGGGFECALACHTLVAERGVQMGLPEVLFDLFPGMGALTFLARRVPMRQAEKIVLEGRLFTSEELFEMGVVDVLAEPGQGVEAVRQLVQDNQRIPNALRALNRVRAGAQEASLAELMRITEVWVDTAMQLPERSLRAMALLVGAQRRRVSLPLGIPIQAA